jgi:hypothetical protein
VAVYIKASNTGSLDQFGASLALSADGNTLVIGAPLEDSSTTGVTNVSNELAPQAGAVYVLIRSGTAWGQQAYVKASNTGIDDNFGFSVALSADGNTLAVGAPGEDSNATGIDGNQGDNTAGNAGAVYIFIRSGIAWTQQAYVKASSTAAGDQFGFSVALSSDGSTLAVGAIGSVSQAGAAYVFTRSGVTWSQQALVTGVNTGPGDQIGFSVALSGDGNTLAVGAPGEDGSSNVINGMDDNGAPDSGAAYIFVRSGVAWSQEAYVKASNSQAGDQFGVSVSISSDGNTLAVGAPFEDSGTTGTTSTPNELATDAGAAYVFTRAAGVWAQQAYVKASNTQTLDRFGSSVALSGDGNALMVGAINEDGNATGIGGNQTNNGALEAGAVYAYTRSGTVWTQQAYVKASNTEAGDGFGASVALSSNGSTRAIGAQFEDSNATGINGNQGNNTFADAGAVYIYQ